MLLIIKQGSTLRGLRYARNAFRCFRVWLVCLVFGVFLPGIARADDDAPFAWLYTAEVAGKGEVEVEQWLTLTSDRFQERYDALAGRNELEYGASDRLSLALYANYDWTKVVPHGPGAPDAATDTTKFTGFSGEVIYQLLNPSHDPFGLALYAEPGIGHGERALEFKLLLQKNLLDDRLVLAGNANLEYVWSRDSAAGTWDHETALEFLFGFAYRFSPGWSGGIEFANENSYAGHIFAGARAETSAFYLGPTIHYAGDEWWATLGLSGQLPWASNPGGSATVHGYLAEAERFRLRLRVGFEF